MNIEVDLSGEPERIIKKMIKDGWVETPQEALRLALYVFFLEAKKNGMFDW